MRRRVVLVTDGDEYAKRTIELLTKEFGGRCISASQSNPTKLTGKKVVELIMQTPYDPVFVMFDDSGFIGEGSGEKALKYVATHKQIDVLGILAVASNTHHGNIGARAFYNIDDWVLQNIEEIEKKGDKFQEYSILMNFYGNIALVLSHVSLEFRVECCDKGIKLAKKYKNLTRLSAPLS